MSTVQNIIDSVRRVVHAEMPPAVGALRWTSDEMIAWINEAQREIVKLKPEANPKTVAHTVDTTNARQRLDSSLYYKLIRAEANLVPGSATYPSFWVDGIITATFESASYGGANTVYQLTDAALSGLNTSRNPIIVVCGALYHGYGASPPHGLSISATVGGRAMASRTFDVDDGYTNHTMFLATYTVSDAALLSTALAITVEGSNTTTENFDVYYGVVYDTDPTYSHPMVDGLILPHYQDSTTEHFNASYGTLLLSFATINYVDGFPTSLDLEFTPGDAQNYTTSPHAPYQYSFNYGYARVATALTDTYIVDDQGGVDLSHTWLVSALKFPGQTTQAVQGDAVRIVERDVMDTFFPGWTSRPSVHSASNDYGHYLHYVMDESDPLAFWLYPFPTSDMNVLVTASGIPVALTTVNSVIELSSMYHAQIVDYVAFRVMTESQLPDTVHMRGVAFYNRFLAALGAQRQIVREIGQNRNRPPQAEE